MSGKRMDSISVKNVLLDFLPRITGGQQVQLVRVVLIQRYFTGWERGSLHADPINELTRKCGWKSGTMYSCSIIVSTQIHLKISQLSV
jgi:hypothetical protein